jgi:hypothetical protein
MGTDGNSQAENDGHLRFSFFFFAPSFWFGVTSERGCCSNLIFPPLTHVVCNTY